MLAVFLSYARKDHIFAELANEKLNTPNITLWQDTAQIRSGDNWEHEIENAIARSHILLVALSERSANSSYVTYEWAYGIGKGKPVIPLILEECEIHPRLKGVQHLDFTQPGALPWIPLIERIMDIDVDEDFENPAQQIERVRKSSDPIVSAILGYLDQRGFQMASFERLSKHLDGNLSNDDFQRIIDENPRIFRRAKLKDNRQGLSKLVP